jgi:hypothetical protein
VVIVNDGANILHHHPRSTSANNDVCIVDAVLAEQEINGSKRFIKLINN